MLLLQMSIPEGFGKTQPDEQASEKYEKTGNKM
jgi:hypothetical protein